MMFYTRPSFQVNAMFFFRGRVTIVRQTKSAETANGASKIISLKKDFTLITSVAAQHKWISRQLQAGGRKGHFSFILVAPCWGFLRLLDPCWGLLILVEAYWSFLCLVEPSCWSLLRSGEIHLKGWTGELGGLNVQVLILMLTFNACKHWYNLQHDVKHDF